MNPTRSKASDTAVKRSTKTPQTTVAVVRGEAPAAEENTTEQASSQPNQVIDPRVTRARGGDGAAFEVLLAEVRPRALVVANKVLRNPDDAEDAVQEAFLKAWRNLHRFEGRSSFSTWIHRIVMNTSLDLLRRHACRPGAGTEEDSFDRGLRSSEVEIETPERQMVRTEVKEMVHGALAVLSPSHREALTLRELEEHSYEEIAQIAACPIGTVMSRLHHARKKIADELRAAADTDALALAA
jgi:RNA polymerase sigma-70 factor (ECF subfamily)